MGRIEGEILIGRSVDTVFDFVADERNEPLYNPAMTSVEQVTEGTIGTGTRFVAFTRPLGRSLEMAIEFTEFERPKRLSTVTTAAWAEARGTLTFKPVPTGTRMRWSWEIRVKGLKKLLTPVLIVLGRRQAMTIWTNLKRHLETTTIPR